jgi:hypothetical protein
MNAVHLRRSIDCFGGVPACLPEPSQGGGQPLARCGVCLHQAEGDRGPEVAELEIDTVQPLGLITCLELWSRRFRESQAAVAVGDPRGIR